MQPLVSIIIPTYNRVHLLGKTLDSICAQSYPHWECLVIDDGSEDATEELLELYCQQDYRFHYYQRPSTRLKGANACRNYGFELSKGELINWFDSDDIMHPEKIKLQVEKLLFSRLPFCVCQTLVFNERLENIIGLRHERIFSDKPFEDYLEHKIMWLTQAPLWERLFLETFDYLFDETLQAAQEWEFHVRALYKNELYAVIDKPLVFLRDHQENISNHPNQNSALWHYFLARYKIYTNPKIILNDRSRKYLQIYMLKHFKRMIRNKRLKDTIKAYYLLGLKEDVIKIRSSFSALLSFFSFAIFRKGEYFLKNVK